jgi:hypothetical protein
LIAEAEVYRGLMKLEMHNLRIYGLKTKRKLTSFKTLFPMLMGGVPAAGALGALGPLGTLFRRKRGGSSLNRLAAAGVLGWQIYTGISRLFNAFTSPRRSPPYDEGNRLSEQFYH